MWVHNVPVLYNVADVCAHKTAPFDLGKWNVEHLL